MTGFLARQIRRLAALITLAALLVGAPWALWRLGARLLPGHVPTGSEIWTGLTQRDTGQVFLGALVVIGFLAWAAFAICLLAEIGARLAHRPAIRLPGLRAPQAAVSALVGLLIAGTLAINTAPALLAATLPALPHPAVAALTVTKAAADYRAAAGTIDAPLTTPASRAAHHLADHGNTGARQASGPVWTVTKGDTLWSIAEQTLGKGSRWPDIAALNEGRPQHDGRTLVSADWLQVGWTLQLPADAHMPGAGTQGGEETVTVQPGDTLSEIAQERLGDGNLYPKLAAANHIENPNLIYPGQVIRIPAPARHRQPPASQPLPPNRAPHASDPRGSAAASPPAASGHHTEPGPAGAPSADHHAQSPSAAHSTGPAPTSTHHADPAPAGSPMPNAHTGSANGNAADGGTAAAPPTPGAAQSPASAAASEPNGPAPAAAPSRSDGTAGLHASASASHSNHTTWVLGGITSLAAAIAWAGLLLARRRGEQARQPGQRPHPPTPRAARTERALRERAGSINPQRINAALRSITAGVAEHAPAGFDSVIIGTETIELRLARPAPPPSPFTGDEHTWTLPIPTESTDPGEALSAVPALVTLGVTDSGTTIAADAEHLGAMQITGDPQRCRQLVNHLILELAQSPWCDGMHLHLPGRDNRYRALDEYRLASDDTPEIAVKFLAKHLTRTRDLLAGQSITAARATSDIPDAWEPHILIADGNALADVVAVDDLIDRLQTGPPAAAALIAVGQDLGIQPRIVIDSDGTLHLPETMGEVTIRAAGVTDDEIDTVIGLFKAGEQVCDPPDSDAQAIIHQGVADGGGELPNGDGTASPEINAAAKSITIGPSTEPTGRDRDSAHPRQFMVEADRAPVSTPSLNGHQRPPGPADRSCPGASGGPVPRPGADDLHQQRTHRSTGDATDPTLDDDLTEWHSTTGRRLKVAILGSARVAGFGPRRDSQPARITEYAVYLALHPGGVSTDKFVTDLWPDDHHPTDAVRRAAVSNLRVALGEHPDTRDPFVPPAAGGYRLIERLVDAELFNRLAARADRKAQRGDRPQALADLQAALALVRGPVLPEAAGPGYVWLANPDRMDDRVLPMQIIDAAHTATDLALAAGDLPAAEAAAKTGRAVDPYSNVPPCDLIRVAMRAGDQQTAWIWAKLILQTNEVDLPQDLPEPARSIVTDLYRTQRRLAGTKPHR